MINNINVFVKKLRPEARLPEYADDEAAGADLFACDPGIDYPSILIKSQERRLVSTGLAFDIAPGYYGKIFDRSGVANKHGLVTIAGVIDSNYRGELYVLMINLSDRAYHIKHGMKLAQIVFHQYQRANLIEARELSESTRGANGFGSTGE